MGKNDVWFLGGAALLAYYGYTQGWFTEAKIRQFLDGFGGVKKKLPIILPSSINNFTVVGEWNGALAQPIADSMIRNRPGLIVGLGNYDSNESLFAPLIYKIEQANIPSIWAKGADSDDYLGLLGQQGWEFKYEPQGIIFCVLNSVNPTTLEEMLKTSTAKFKIVILNPPPFSPTSKYGQDVTAQEKLIPILTKYKVNLVLSAKNKIYARYIPKFGPNTAVGTTFCIVGTGSDSFDDIGSPNGAIKTVTGKTAYLSCSIGDTTINCKLLTPTGTILDQFTVSEWK